MGQTRIRIVFSGTATARDAYETLLDAVMCIEAVGNADKAVSYGLIHWPESAFKEFLLEVPVSRGGFAEGVLAEEGWRDLVMKVAIVRGEECFDAVRLRVSSLLNASESEGNK